jgi:hypothetical protein
MIHDDDRTEHSTSGRPAVGRNRHELCNLLTKRAQDSDGIAPVHVEKADRLLADHDFRSGKRELEIIYFNEHLGSHESRILTPVDETVLGTRYHGTYGIVLDYFSDDASKVAHKVVLGNFPDNLLLNNGSFGTKHFDMINLLAKVVTNLCGLGDKSTPQLLKHAGPIDKRSFNELAEIVPDRLRIMKLPFLAENLGDQIRKETKKEMYY